MDEPRRPWGGATRLDPDVLVYRALWDARHLKGHLRYRAFIRKEKDKDGLSIANASVCSPEEFCATFIRCFGTFTLSVGGVRSVGLDVIPDTEPDAEHPCDHGAITGLPFQEINPEDAEYLATELKNQVLDVWDSKAT
ncbi:MAG: hypothetical protein M3437_08325 [Chloroflexota bacterium]|nr:hypothetical protein [Chloroflexota bacterium]MDQ5867178.1 hypothetical protein [Chloroflexota bacterium]